MEKIRPWLIAFLGFCAGVGQQFLAILRRITQRLAAYEASSEHIVKRILKVEGRIDGLNRRLAFLYRWLRYVFYHYHLLPNWLKIAKLVAIAVLIFGPGMWESFQQSHQREKLYTELYDYYYHYYISQRQPQATARYYAGVYAQRYAEYYTSPAYQEALRYALPEREVEIETEQSEVATQLPEEAQSLGEEGKQPLPPESEPAAESDAEEAPAPAEVASLIQPTLLPIGVELIKHFEGLMLKPYKDAGYYSIGYGHLMRASERFTKITEKQAEKLLRKDLRIAESVVREQVEVPLTHYQFSALVSLVYNIGGYQFRTSTLLKKLNRGDYEGAAEEILRWNKSGRRTLKGLKRRRMAEYRLFTGKWAQPEA